MKNARVEGLMMIRYPDMLRCAYDVSALSHAVLTTSRLSRKCTVESLAIVSLLRDTLRTWFMKSATRCKHRSQICKRSFPSRRAAYCVMACITMLWCEALVLS
jgi:hypothetical protein